MSETKAQLEARLRRLDGELRAKARQVASLTAENLDLRWQLGIDKPEPDHEFNPPGHVGTPGWVRDYQERLKAELASRSRRPNHA